MVPLPRPKTSLLLTYRPKLFSKRLMSIPIALFWFWLHFCKCSGASTIQIWPPCTLLSVVQIHPKYGYPNQTKRLTTSFTTFTKQGAVNECECEYSWIFSFMNDRLEAQNVVNEYCEWNEYSQIHECHSWIILWTDEPANEHEHEHSMAGKRIHY